MTITERTVSFSSGPAMSMAILVGLGLMVLLLFAIAVITFGFAFTKSGEGFRQFWVTGIVALAGAGLLVWRGAQQLTRIGRITIDRAGNWTLLSPVGRRIGVLPPDRLRSLTLWANRNPTDGGATSAMMEGALRLESDELYRLSSSGTFDVLIQLGYGAYWLDHPNMTLGEEKQRAQAKARSVYVGEGKARGLALPLHTFDDAGLEQVRRFLASKTGE